MIDNFDSERANLVTKIETENRSVTKYVSRNKQSSSLINVLLLEYKNKHTYLPTFLNSLVPIYRLNIVKTTRNKSLL